MTNHFLTKKRGRNLDTCQNNKVAQVLLYIRSIFVSVCVRERVCVLQLIQKYIMKYQKRTHTANLRCSHTHDQTEASKALMKLLSHSIIILCSCGTADIMTSLRCTTNGLLFHQF